MNDVLIIGGPTSSGKSNLAVVCAKHYDGEVVSADARQVYQGMTIGTGKITQKEMQGIRHWMLDVADPRETYSAFLYAQEAYDCILNIQKRGKQVVVAGGSGFYIHGLRYSNALDRKKTDSLYERFPHHYITLMPDKNELKRRIETRLKQRWDGIVKEVETLHGDGLTYERMDALGLEYRFVSRFMRGLYNEKEAYTLLLRAIRQYAKRQYTWFKKYGGKPFATADEARTYVDSLYGV